MPTPASGTMRARVVAHRRQHRAFYTPAHRSKDVIAALSHNDRLIAEANAFVDLKAKEAVLLHPQPTPAQTRDLDYQLCVVATVAATLSQTLRLFPVKYCERRPKCSLHKRKHSLGGWHAWARLPTSWRCLSCVSSLPLTSREGDLPALGCKNLPARLERIKGGGFGHNLVVIEYPSGDVVVCLRCGSWSMRRCRGLVVQCPGCPATRGKAYSLQRVRSGKHPDAGLPLCREYATAAAEKTQVLDALPHQPPSRPASVSQRVQSNPFSDSALGRLLSRVRAKEAATSTAAYEAELCAETSRINQQLARPH